MMGGRWGYQTLVQLKQKGQTNVESPDIKL